MLQVEMIFLNLKLLNRRVSLGIFVQALRSDPILGWEKGKRRLLSCLYIYSNTLMEKIQGFARVLT